jgi:hypothetical protein
VALHAERSTGAPSLLRVPLTPNRADPARALRVLAALGVTMGSAAGAAAVLDALRANRVLASALVASVAFAGMLVTVVVGGRGLSPPTHILELDEASVRVIDARTSAVVAGAAWRDVRVECTTARYTGRARNADVAGVALVLPGSRMVVGTLSPSFTWSRSPGALVSPDYLTPEGSWLALVDRLGLGGNLSVEA